MKIYLAGGGPGNCAPILSSSGNEKRMRYNLEALRDKQISTGSGFIRAEITESGTNYHADCRPVNE